MGFIFHKLHKTENTAGVQTIFYTYKNYFKNIQTTARGPKSARKPFPSSRKEIFSIMKNSYIYEIGYLLIW